MKKQTDRYPAGGPVDEQAAGEKTRRRLELKRRPVADLTEDRLGEVAGGHPHDTCEPTCPRTCPDTCVNTCADTCPNTCGPCPVPTVEGDSCFPACPDTW